jgi:hypothetical protein
MEQRTLSSDQIGAFYHDEFVKDQVEHFDHLTRASPQTLSVPVVDIGGGMGYFASAVGEQLRRSVKVVDMDALSVEHCKSNGLEAELGDALALQPTAFSQIACFNLILHHLVAPTGRDTTRLQESALARWCVPGKFVFVNEYIYESYLYSLSAWLIYAVTSSRLLSKLAQTVSTVVPSLRANTFGVGVRFRSHAEWVELFGRTGFDVAKVAEGRMEHVSMARRVLLIKSIRRNSYLLLPAQS